ncbi:helix-turn-helix DNA-binding domain protein [Gordonia phage VanLee]|uniref:Helix-turn-helix DNA-binding domain protein n=1 Tax=Gordonia phage VanLee TaxID=2845816 RepID=A0A8F2DA11_9CAUD|nr:helix-turn-helix DNA-binding domain protein [Gordonia phage VanLee]QWS68120.1 helix-turn-helix DNA-binding domain protein [Gordonia phage VanLee]
MPAAAPLDEEEQVLVRRLFDEGCGRNEISRRSGITKARVSRFCSENGLIFDKARVTAKATEQRQRNMREMREQIAYRLAARAEALLDRLDRPYRYYEKTSDGNMVLVELPEHPMREEHTAITAASTAMRSYMEISETLVEKTAAEEKSMLVQLQEQMKAAVATADDLARRNEHAND